VHSRSSWRASPIEAAASASKMLHANVMPPIVFAQTDGYGPCKQRRRWTEDEHRKLLEGLRLYGRDWKRIQMHVGTRNAAQLRSHAQKYFVKVMKEGSGEYIPPPQSRRTCINPNLTLPTVATMPGSGQYMGAGWRDALAGACHKEDVSVGMPESESPSDVHSDARMRPRSPLVELGADSTSPDSFSPGSSAMRRHAPQDYAHAPRMLPPQVHAMHGMQDTRSWQGVYNRRPTLPGRLPTVTGTRMLPAISAPLQPARPIARPAMDVDGMQHGFQGRTTSPDSLGSREDMHKLGDTSPTDGFSNLHMLSLVADTIGRRR